MFIIRHGPNIDTFQNDMVILYTQKVALFHVDREQQHPGSMFVGLDKFNRMRR
jgi:hypothetical protein